MAKEQTIGTSTTVSISLIVTIVMAAISAGVLWAQVGYLQQQIANNATANTTSIYRIEESIKRLREHAASKDIIEEHRRYFESILQRHEAELLRARK